MKPSTPLGIAGVIARAFIDSRLTPLLIIGSVLLGVLAILVLPREEEPQIKVPLVDVMVALPGACAGGANPDARWSWFVIGWARTRNALWSSSTRSSRPTRTACLREPRLRWS